MPLNNIAALGGQTGTYTGNDNANREITHGLGRIPKFVTIYKAGPQMSMNLNTNVGYVSLTDFSGEWTVNAPFSSSAFRVGNAANYAGSMNASGATYRWFAI